MKVNLTVFFAIAKSLCLCDPHSKELTQLTFTCSKSTIKTLKEGVKYAQS